MPRGAAGFAGAKVNLYLHVGPVGDDGYHPIDSLMVFADVGDRLTMEAAPARVFACSGPFAASVPEGDGNLAMRAAALLAGPAGFRLELEKVLPVAAGLGGGSADAAAALRLANDLFDGRRDVAALCALGLPLGADIPACVVGRSVIARGRGERLLAAPALPLLPAVLVNPRVPTPTARVFAAFDAMLAPPSGMAPPPPAAFETVEDLVAWLAGHTRNDLEAPARSLVPAAGEAIHLLAASDLALLARMSGSGASAFALCASPDDAAALAARIQAQRPSWWVAACTLA